MESYDQKKQRLMAQMREAGEGTSVALKKDTSNLFRSRKGGAAAKLSVRDFTSVLSVNAEEGWVEVEGMTTYEKLVDALLPLGFMPAVVPQLKSITIGGAVSGIGIEATSFRQGLVHETILEMDVLLPDGSVVVASPTNEHRDLFYGLANSYGTLGYILKLKARILPVRPFVRVEHRRYRDADEFFRAMEAACASDADFVDGVIFSADEMYVSMASFTDEAAHVSDYTYRRIYYRSIQETQTDFLTTRGYIWRWDTDWFWCSKNLGAQNPILRFLLGRHFLNSVTYMKFLRWNSRWRLTERWNRMRGIHAEAVIQDILIPCDRAATFLGFLLKEIGITPIWICPTRQRDGEAHYPLFPLKPQGLYIDFGFWDVVRTREAYPPGHFNRLIERETATLGGIKSLYSEGFYSRAEFWAIYGKEAYDRLKKTYDPKGKLRDLYQKCVEMV